MLGILFSCSIDKVPKIKAKTLVIHGTEDDVVNISHGLAIHEQCESRVTPLWVEVIEFILTYYTLLLGGI